MELNITDERMEEMVNAAIVEHVHESADCVYIRDKIDRLIRTAVEKELSDRFDAAVDAIVSDFMTEPIDIMDGWSSTVHYDTYRDFLMAKLGEKVMRDYEVKRMLENVLKNKVDAIWKKIGGEVVKEVLARHAEEEKSV